MTRNKNRIHLTARGEMVADILGGIGIVVFLAAFLSAAVVR